MQKIVEKIIRKIRGIAVHMLRDKPWYPKLYKSYWHKEDKSSFAQQGIGLNYLSAIPNPGAGIGHQMANWIAGYWFSKKFKLQFAHVPFSNQKWEHFLNFGENETTVDSLIKIGFKAVRLPLFSEEDAREMAMIQKIIDSYRNDNIVFICEQDQFYADQYGVIAALQHKFYSAECRKTEKLIYDPANFNIAIHVRRGDIGQVKSHGNQNLAMRFQSNDYFFNTLENVIESLKIDKPIHVFLFSQGVQEDFKEFEIFKNITFCLDMDAQQSFLHMVYADLLITSKSSFSYKPALLNKGIKVCPQDFWHGYLNSDDWVKVNEHGQLLTEG